MLNFAHMKTITNVKQIIFNKLYDKQSIHFER